MIESAGSEDQILYDHVPYEPQISGLINEQYVNEHLKGEGIFLNDQLINEQIDLANEKLLAGQLSGVNIYVFF